MVFLILLMLLGLIPAFIAKSKGRDAVLWWVYGALLFVIALPHALLISEEASKPVLDVPPRVACPFCLEDIAPEALICPFCRKQVK